MSSSCRNIATRGIRDGRTAIQHSNWRQFVHGNNLYDAIVIGGGPAGSTAAAILASKGRSVVLLEKEKFPRYHIGESLLPYTYFPLQRMGLIDRMKTSHFPKKYSVQFVSVDGRASQPFYFFTHLKHEAACTWQVLRSEFDQMLLDNARAKGAEVQDHGRSEEHTSELQSQSNLVCRLLLEKKKK